MDKEKIQKLRLILVPAKPISVEPNVLSETYKRGFNFDCIKSLENTDTDLDFINATDASECISAIVGQDNKERILSQIIESANNIGQNPNDNIILRFRF